MQTVPSFPNSDDAQRICAIMSGKADDEYERLVDRGVELERTLCYTPGYVPKVGSNEPKIAAKEEELSYISADFGKRMLEFQQNPHTARTAGLRLMLDNARHVSPLRHMWPRSELLNSSSSTIIYWVFFLRRTVSKCTHSGAKFL
jgi:hypothetical protein